MLLEELIARRARMLTEGSVYELLRRDPRIAFDPAIAHAGLIYDPASRALLAEIHHSYFAVAKTHGLPMLAFTDTWRASAERVAASRFSERHVNRDNVAFLREIAARAGAAVFIAGLTGPRSDGYRPCEAPSRAEATELHQAQIDELAAAGVDLLFGATLPNLDEAHGIAAVMAATGKPWMLSFVVRPSGHLLDGTHLHDAIALLDAEVSPRAAGFSINCVHPSIAMRALSTLDAPIAARVVAFQGNTSALSPEELDGIAEVQSEDPSLFAESMARLAASVPIVGGCCGTATAHMEAVANRLTSMSQ